MFTNTWKTQYNGRAIIVTNSWFGSTSLFIDGLLKDTSSGMFSVTLTYEDIVVKVKSGFLTVRCEIFVNGEIIFPTADVSSQ